MKAKILDSSTVFFIDDEEYNQLFFNRSNLIKERDSIADTGNEGYIEYLDFMINRLSSNIDGFLPYKPADEEPKLSEYQGLHITYHVENGEIVQMFTVVDNDKEKVCNEVERLKKTLSDDDYKIIKCYEASLLGANMPYNVIELHKNRQAIRDEINRLEAIIASIV